MNLLIPFINIAFILFIAWIGWRSDHSSYHKIYWPAFFLKLGAGVLLGYVYGSHYVNSDTVRFFDSSMELTELARKDFWAYLSYLWNETEAPYAGENRTLFFVKLVSLFSLATNDNYWLVSLYFSFFSFLSAWWLAGVINKHFPDFTWSAVFALLIFPSSVFWSSGVIKEATSVMALYFLTGVYIHLWVRHKLKAWHYPLIAISIWIIWNLKYYYVTLFLAVVATAFLTRWFVANRMKPTNRTAYREFILYSILLMVMFFVVTFIHPNFYPQRILEVIVENNVLFLNSSLPEKVVHFNNLEPTIGSIIVNMPWAIISGLFRPFIWEAGNIFQVMVSIENIGLFILICLALGNIKKMLSSNDRILIFSILVYCLLLCAFLTLSAPNFGTLVRYKIGFIPFLVALVAYNSAVVHFIQKLFKTPGNNL